MKKILIGIMCLGFGINAFAQSVSENIVSTLKEISGLDTKVLSVSKLTSVDGVSVAILEDASKQSFPIYVSNDGKSVWALSQFFKFSNDEDNKLIAKKLEEVEKNNANIKNAQIENLFKRLPPEGFVNIDSKIKTDKLLTIVTEPDCPYCRNELGSLIDRLDTANVRIVFASVHDQRSFVKAKLILDEVKKLKSSDREKIVAIFEKYYKDIPLSDEQMQMDTTVIEQTTNAIFGSGLIRGVPYVHEGTK